MKPNRGTLTWIISSRIPRREYHEDTNDFWGFDPAPGFLDKNEQDKSFPEGLHSRSQGIIPARSTFQPGRTLCRNSSLRADSRVPDNQALWMNTRPKELPRQADSEHAEMSDPWGFDPVMPFTPFTPKARQAQADPVHAATYPNRNIGPNSPVGGLVSSSGRKEVDNCLLPFQKLRKPTASAAGLKALSTLHRRPYPYRRGNKFDHSKVRKPQRLFCGRRPKKWGLRPQETIFKNNYDSENYLAVKFADLGV